MNPATVFLPAPFNQQIVMVAEFICGLFCATYPQERKRNLQEK